MKFRRKVGSYKKRLIISVLVLVLILISFSFYFMQPVILRYALSVAQTVMLDSANEAIVNILEQQEVSYGDIVNLSQNSDGYVTSLEINIKQINGLKSKISNETGRLVAAREKYDVSVPLGSFFGNNFTNGLGPDITFKMHITTTCFVDFSHEFKSAGINQVLHIINVDIKIKGCFVLMGYNKPISTETSAIAAQTVIVGKTPDAFTNVVESPTDNTGGLINDYGAIAE